jgi:preprotein translocase subunit SecD
VRDALGKENLSSEMAKILGESGDQNILVEVMDNRMSALGKEMSKQLHSVLENKVKQLEAETEVRLRNAIDEKMEELRELAVKGQVETRKMAEELEAQREKRGGYASLEMMLKDRMSIERKLKT